MRNYIVTSHYNNADEARKELKGLILLYKEAAQYGITFLPREDVMFRTPEGRLVALYLTDVFDEAAQAERADAFKDVSGDLRNRPDIIGRNASQQLLKVDGTPTDYTGVRPEHLDEGVADIYGYYRYKNSAPGVPNCGLTSPTKANLARYLRILAIERQVTEIYKRVLPAEYAEQMKYLDTVMPQWKTPGSAFSSTYGLKNKPCAVHVDKFDIPTATGVITTTGNFAGNELAMPEFGIAFDVQPSDILFLDVHRWHGNFPRTEGSRISQVFFVRKGLHECP
jgi:hypothetical protein